MRPWIGAKRVQVGAYGRLLAYGDWEGGLEVEPAEVLLRRLQGQEMRVPAPEQHIRDRSRKRVRAGSLEVTTK